jgi:hypothetical protein
MQAPGIFSLIDSNSATCKAEFAQSNTSSCDDVPCDCDCDCYDCVDYE